MTAIFFIITISHYQLVCYLAQTTQLYPTPAVSVPAIRDAGSDVASTVLSTTFICEGSSAENDSGNGRQLHITPGSLPDSANKLTKPARALLMRLLEKDPKVRLRSLRQLQQSAFYLGFNFEHIKAKKVSPKSVLENHIDSHLAKLSSLKITNKNDFLEFDQEVVS